MLDEITYIPNGGDLRKQVFRKETIVDIKREHEALSAQLADFKAGKTDNPEDQATVDAAIVNYSEQVSILESKMTEKNIKFETSPAVESVRLAVGKE